LCLLQAIRVQQARRRVQSVREGLPAPPPPTPHRTQRVRLALTLWLEPRPARNARLENTVLTLSKSQAVCVSFFFKVERDSFFDLI
jgi:hypothetical protein